MIVTADDFGSSAEVNKAVVAAYQDGVLRYASLMVLRPHAQDAVLMARENPGLGVGLHLEMCGEKPALWGLRYYFDPRHRRQIAGRIRAQIEKFLSFGLKPTHIDGHFHLHVHPAIFPILADLAREYRIPRTRLPAGEFGIWLRRSPIHRRLAGSASRGALAGTFAALKTVLERNAKGLVVPERTFGLLRSGLMDEEYVLFLLSNLPEGLTEIYFHPSASARDRAKDSGAAPAPSHRSYAELAALTSPRVRKFLEEARIALVAEEKQAPSS